jgi:ABC-type amino acid transport system permease subunit
VILFWLHYPLQDILGISIDPFLTSLFTLSLLNTLFVAGVVAKMSGEIAMDYREAAFVHGLSYRRMLTEIDIPLVIRLSAPQVIGYQVVVLHMTLFASLISVNELFRTAQRINAVEYQPVEIYSLLVLFFAAISAPLLIFSAYLDRKQRGWALGT